MPPVPSAHAPEPTVAPDPFLTERSEILLQAVQAAARNLAMRGDHTFVSPVSGPESSGHNRPLKIGFFGNLANQSFITVRALRRLGHDIELVVQDNNIDSYPLSRTIWEEREIEIDDLDDSRLKQAGYVQPAYVRNVPYNMEKQLKYQGRFNAVPEVMDLYHNLTGRLLARDEGLVLAQWMGHWDYLAAMQDYDVVHLSMWPICLGLFAPKPYVACPLGGDLYISAFKQDVQGLMFRASFRGASRIAVAETDYPLYLDRLETRARRCFMPLVVDTEVYQSSRCEPLRAEWQGQVGGDHFLLNVCRQSWEWKGSDRLIRAFARFRKQGGNTWRLLLQAWGDDLERSRTLVTELGLDDVTLWLSMCSKPLLRQRQCAADVVADQFVMEGYGASVLESLAAGKPVVMAPVPRGSEHHFRAGPPPLVGAKSEDEIVAALLKISDPVLRDTIGGASRKWVEAEHGYQALAPHYMAMFEGAAGRASRDAVTEEPAGAPGLADVLREAHRLRRSEIHRRWNRTLPLAEGFTDRWEKALFLGFGEGTSIYDSAVVLGNVKVGEKSWIGPNCVLDGSGGLEIGATCSISAGCQIYSHDTVDWAVTGGAAPYRHAATTIGDNVYIGPGSVIAGGSTIGAHAIIGALSFVRGVIPPNSFAVGQPARIIGRVDVAADGTVTIHKTDQS